jgi:hypothetical protein
MEGMCKTIHMHNIGYNIRQKKGNMKKRKTKNYMLIQKSNDFWGLKINYKWWQMQGWKKCYMILDMPMKL